MSMDVFFNAMTRPKTYGYDRLDDSTKLFHRVFHHNAMEHPGPRPTVTSPAALHEVKRPKLIGRVSWEWERNQGQGNSTKEFGVKANRKPTFEMNTRRR